MFLYLFSTEPVIKNFFHHWLGIFLQHFWWRSTIYFKMCLYSCIFILHLLIG